MGMAPSAHGASGRVRRDSGARRMNHVRHHGRAARRPLAHLYANSPSFQGEGVARYFFGGLVGGNIHPLRQLEDFVLANPVGQSVGKLP